MTMNDPSRPVFTLPPQSLRIDKGTKVKVYGLSLSITVDKRVIWMLNELGIPYEFVGYDLLKGEHASQDYLRIHPSALVPAIQVGDFYMVESVAILMLLADRFPERGLAPPPDDIERPAYLQWMFYGASTLEGVAARVTLAVPKGLAPDEAELQAQLEVFDRYVMILEKVLEERDYLLQRGFSAADMSVAWALYSADYLGLLEQYPILKSYYDRLAARPAFQAAFQGEDYYEMAERAHAGSGDGSHGHGGKPDGSPTL
jgi:glutathione S-transferase